MGVTGIPVVAERTAASSAVPVVTRASAANESSDQIGDAVRYRRVAPGPGYQQTPKPSTFTVPPPRMSAGAWCSNECGTSSTGDASVTGGPT